ncbi:hypothetical protein [Sphingobacterium luzhongxinii]|uniref:hypothetical protein n=1 Tax=Sphingobacterium luzhongxinii TaxID=2654181 RepID=UPI0013DC4830|nr:hypothetical protein [Sphingobacterium sp. xlx-73]
MEKKQKYNQVVIAYLTEKYGVSTRYVRASLDPRNPAPFADTIRKDYKKKDEEIKKLLSV